MKQDIPLWMIIVFIMGVFIGGFILGTVAGFSTAMQEISSCTEIACADLGIENAGAASIDMCEVCSEDGLKIFKMAR